MVIRNESNRRGREDNVPSSPGWRIVTTQQGGYDTQDREAQEGTWRDYSLSEREDLEIGEEMTYERQS